MKLQSGQDEYGAPFKEYRYLTEGELWCYAKQLSQEQVWQGMQFQTDEKRLFVLNYRSDIAVTDLIEYAGQFYEITRVDRTDDYLGDLYIYAKDATSPDYIADA